MKLKGRFCTAAVTMKGTMKVGLNLLITTIHPMRVGGTLMSSMLFNIALVLLACLAAIQFCAQVRCSPDTICSFMTSVLGLDER